MLSNNGRGVVLIVEDDELILDLIKRYLSSLDIEIFTATDGINGVKKYKNLIKQNKKPDLVIMDISLPIVDGIETTKKILNVDPDAIIYGFSAFYGTQKAEKLREAGAKKIIPRSIGFAAFREIIKNSLPQKIIAHS